MRRSFAGSGAHGQPLARHHGMQRGDNRHIRADEEIAVIADGDLRVVFYGEIGIPEKVGADVRVCLP